MFGNFKDHIRQQEADRILAMSEAEWREAVKTDSGTERPCSLSGVVIELEWSNPNSVVIPHFWMDEKLRGNGLGSVLTGELISQLRSVSDRDVLYITAQASGGKTRGLLEKHGFVDVQTHEKEVFDEAVVEARLDL